mgnify:FL=1
MKNSVKKNYIYNLMYQILVILLPLITAPYISRVLGAENIGIYSYTTSISAYFILFGSLGVSLYAQREIAFHQDNKKENTKTFIEIVLLRTITMFISIAVFCITFVSNGEYGYFYKILIVELIAQCLDISWFFIGLEDFKKTVSRNLIIKFISVVSIFVLVKTPEDLNIYFWIYVLSVLIGNLSLWFYLPKYLVKVNVKELNIFKHLKPTLALFIPEIAIQVYTVLDKTMIGAIWEDKSEVGYYQQSEKIIKLLLTIITSLGTVLLPRIASCFANNKKQEVFGYLKKSFNFVFILAFPMVFGIIAVADKFVPLFFGPGYDKVVILMSVISPIILFIGMSNVIGKQYLLPTKRQKQYTISVVTGAVVNLIMNSCLIWKFGALGASIGTVIAEFTVTLVQLIFVRKEFDIKGILKLSIKYIISSIIMFVACKLVGLFSVNDFVSIVLQVGVGTIVYILMLLVLKDKFTFDMINEVKNKVFKVKNNS